MTETTPKTTTRAKPAAKNDEPQGIIQIIAAIAKEAGPLAKTKEQGSGVPFAFRGVDAVVNHLSASLDKYGVINTATVLNKNVTQRELSGGKAITQTDITVEYTFYAPDGSSLATEAAGLAQDYADRSSAQAQSVAYRVALLQLFHLPTDADSPEKAGQDTQAYIEANAVARTPAPVADNGEELKALKQKVHDTLVARGDIEKDDTAKLTALGNEFFGGRPGWNNAVPALQKWLTELEKGEVK